MQESSEKRKQRVLEKNYRLKRQEKEIELKQISLIREGKKLSFLLCKPLRRQLLSVRES